MKIIFIFFNRFRYDNNPICWVRLLYCLLKSNLHFNQSWINRICDYQPLYLVSALIIFPSHTSLPKGNCYSSYNCQQTAYALNPRW
jgi:hypothetical protein